MKLMESNSINIIIGAIEYIGDVEKLYINNIWVNYLAVEFFHTRHIPIRLLMFSEILLMLFCIFLNQHQLHAARQPTYPPVPGGSPH